MQKELKELMEKKGWSQSQAAKYIGLGGSTLSEYMNGNYKGDIEAIEARIKALIDDFSEGNIVRKVNFFAETENSGKIIAALNYLKRSVTSEMENGVTGSGEIAVIVGKAGRGKTYTLKKYVQENKTKCILVEAESNFTASRVIKNIAEKLGIGIDRNVESIKRDVIDALYGRGMIIIVDEAEHLDNESIEQIRRIADKTGAGVVLAGLDTMLDRFRRLKGDSEYLFSRIIRIFCIGETSRADVEKIVREYFKNENYTNEEMEKLIKSYYENCYGSIRRLVKLIPASINVMRLNKKEKVTPKIIEETNRQSMIDTVGELRGA